MAHGLFRLSAGLCRTFTISGTAGALLNQLVFMLGGFTIPRALGKPQSIISEEAIQKMQVDQEEAKESPRNTSRWKTSSNSDGNIRIMELVELDDLQDAIVGLPGVTGLSTKQRKRLKIAVELVANPSIIFMDEPATGLDARAAAIVMRTVQEESRQLLLMKRGGQFIHMGPLGQDSSTIIEYFEAIPGVMKFREKMNPATWMLEASSVAAEVQLEIDFAQWNKELVKELGIPPPGAKDLYFPTKCSQPTWEQLKSCNWKQWLTYWRSPDYNLRTPKWWLWYYWICPVAWTVYGLIVSQYGDVEDIIKVPGSEDKIIKFYITNHYGFHTDYMGLVAGVLQSEEGRCLHNGQLAFTLNQSEIQLE
ncbi:hypothetical protein Sjap_019576 [Stephania japonica]|uniref:ABC transporter domain-containing protein n=1 Tax=Stephania japonica TaxID=461633 RepID=A0AAP0F1W1_9MAGN